MLCILYKKTSFFLLNHPLLIKYFSTFFLSTHFPQVHVDGLKPEKFLAYIEKKFQLYFSTLTKTDLDKVEIPEEGRSLKVVIGLLYRYYVIVSSDDSLKATKKANTATPEVSQQLHYDDERDIVTTAKKSKKKDTTSKPDKTSVASVRKRTSIFEKLMTTSRSIIKRNLDAHLKSLLNNNVSTLGGTCMLERNHALIAKRRGFDLAATSTVLYPFASEITSFGQYIKWLDADMRFSKKPNEFFRLHIQTEIDNENDSDDEMKLTCQFLHKTGPLEMLLSQFWSSADLIDRVYLKALRNLYEILYSVDDNFESWSNVSTNELSAFFVDSASFVLFERNNEYDNDDSVMNNSQIGYKYSLAASLGDTTQENAVTAILQEFGVVWNESLDKVVCT